MRAAIFLHSLGPSLAVCLVETLLADSMRALFLQIASTFHKRNNGKIYRVSEEEKEREREK